MTDAVLSGQLRRWPPADLTKPATPVEVRERLLDLLRRDLVGPHPDLDPDLAREVLTGVAPSTWYLSGFLGPRQKIGRARRSAAATGSDAAKEEAAEDLLEAQRGSEGLSEVVPGRGDAPDEASPEAPPARSFQPSSLGLTVLLPRDARQLQARVTWGDYVTEPRLHDAIFIAAAREAAEERGEVPKIPAKQYAGLAAHPAAGAHSARSSSWRRAAAYHRSRQRRPDGSWWRTRARRIGRPIDTAGIDGVKRELLAVSVFVINARPTTLRFRDVAFCFQVRLQLDFPRWL